MVWWSVHLPVPIPLSSSHRERMRRPPGRSPSVLQRGLTLSLVATAEETTTEINSGIRGQTTDRRGETAGVISHLFLIASEASCRLRLGLFLASGPDIIRPEVPQVSCSHEGKLAGDCPLYALSVDATRFGPAQPSAIKQTKTKIAIQLKKKNRLTRCTRNGRSVEYLFLSTVFFIL